MVENLKPFNELTKEEQREIAKKGGKASAKARQQKKTFKTIFEALLQDKSIDDAKLTNDQAMAMQMIKEALNGNVKAFEVVRDTIGEKPTDKVDQNITGQVTLEQYIKQVSDKNEY